jgi:hypothetical protein
MYSWVSTEFRWHGIPSTQNSVNRKFRQHGIPLTRNSVDTEFRKQKYTKLHGIPGNFVDFKSQSVQYI